MSDSGFSPSESCPGFLVLIDGEPEKAKHKIRNYMEEYFSDKWECFRQDLYTFFTYNDFYELRKYKDSKEVFVSWLQGVVNRYKDNWRKFFNLDNLGLEQKNILRQPWPKFLEILDGEPEKVKLEFHNYIGKLEGLKPPFLSLIPKDLRENLIKDFSRYCLERSFRKLRQYNGNEKSFVSWLRQELHNYAVDWRKSPLNKDNLSLEQIFVLGNPESERAKRVFADYMSKLFKRKPRQLNSIPEDKREDFIDKFYRDYIKPNLHKLRKRWDEENPSKFVSRWILKKASLYAHDWTKLHDEENSDCSVGGQLYLLHQPWPGFLNLLDSDPKKAMEEFYNYMETLLKIRPRILNNYIPKQEHKDFINELYLHCVVSDFKKVRSYNNWGKPFSHWLLKVAYYKAMDWIEKVHPKTDSLSRDIIDIDRTEYYKIKEIIIYYIENFFNDRQQRLLKLSLKGHKVPDIVILIGEPDNKKELNDEILYLKRKLRRLLWGDDDLKDFLL